MVFVWFRSDSFDFFHFRPAKILQKTLAESNFLVNYHLNEISEMKGNTTEIQWVYRTHFMILIDFWRVHQISILKNFTELEFETMAQNAIRNSTNRLDLLLSPLNAESECVCVCISMSMADGFGISFEFIPVFVVVPFMLTLTVGSFRFEWCTDGTCFNKFGDFVRKLNLLGENLTSSGFCVSYRYNFSCSIHVVRRRYFFGQFESASNDLVCRVGRYEWT